MNDRGTAPRPGAGSIPATFPEERILPGIAPFAACFDGWLLDQWGVIHDGRSLFTEAVEALGRLRGRGARLVLLSNSGRRARHSERHLRGMGFDPELVDGIVTSGEVAWKLLKERDEPPFRDLGRRCFLITRFGDTEVVEGLDLELVDDPAEADFLFLSGVDSPVKPIEDYLPLLERAARRRPPPPALCSNPDRMAPEGEGFVFSPGTLAEIYARTGARVIYTGKPHRWIYREALARLADIPREKIVAVGDSFEHDVVGAVRQGLAAVFVTQGLHREAFPEDAPKSAWARKVAELAARFGAQPDRVIPRFRW